jgi:hypothetical protein
MNLNDIIISRSKLEEAIYLETLRAEIEHDGKYVVVSTAWLDRLNAIIAKRKLEA